MSENKKPQPIIEDGVPFCSQNCEHFEKKQRSNYWCHILDSFVNHDICLPAVREMAEELKELKAIMSSGEFCPHEQQLPGFKKCVLLRKAQAKYLDK